MSGGGGGQAACEGDVIEMPYQQVSCTMTVVVYCDPG